MVEAVAPTRAPAAAPAGGAPVLRSFTDTFATELLALCDTDERVVAISAGMVHSTGLGRIEAQHPERVYDVGIAEQHAATFAAGLALAGRRPVLALYSSFFNRCFDQFVLDVSLHDAPVTFVLDRAGITGNDGPSHHGINDLALALLAPGVEVYAPSCPAGVGPALREAVARGVPAVVRIPKGAAAQLEGFDGPPGTTRRLHRGDDLCIAAVGAMVAPAVEAAALLAADGVQVDVWDVRRVRPLDERFLAAALRAPVVLTVEDGVASGGAGSWVGHQLGERGWRGTIRHAGVPIAHVPHGSQAGVRSLLGLDAAGIAARARSALG
jgi:1-deoxy-D-xylulose-5-phosphate synthase